MNFSVENASHVSVCDDHAVIGTDENTILRIGSGEIRIDTKRLGTVYHSGGKVLSSPGVGLYINHVVQYGHLGGEIITDDLGIVVHTMEIVLS